MTEFRPGGFQMIPPVIKNLIIINVLVFLAQLIPGVDVTLTNLFGLHDIHSVYFKPHQLVTYMFLHGGWEHIIINMLVLWMFSSILENYWGGKKFLIFYIVCGIGAAALQLAVLYYENGKLLAELSPMLDEDRIAFIYGTVNEATVGASGAIFGCMAAFGYLFPNSLIYLYFFVPIKAKWFVMGYAAYELFLGVRGSVGDNVAHWAHLGGGLVGLLLVVYWNRNNRRNFY
jgi:membrane associated rhomboid family serine protease